MIDTNKKEIKDFLKFLRKKLISNGCSRIAAYTASPSAVINKFRYCEDCQEELFTESQLIHAVLEFEKPERALEVLLEDLEVQEDPEEICECEDCLISRSEISEDCEDCSPVTSEIEVIPFPSEKEIVIRGKNILDGAESIDDAIRLLHQFSSHLESLKKEGYTLIEPVEDDYGFLTKND